MTGAEHYKAAEESLKFAAETDADFPNQERYHLLAAQTHATLALAAATAKNDARWTQLVELMLDDLACEPTPWLDAAS